MTPLRTVLPALPGSLALAALAPGTRALGALSPVLATAWTLIALLVISFSLALTLARAMPPMQRTSRAPRGRVVRPSQIHRAPG